MSPRFSPEDADRLAASIPSSVDELAPLPVSASNVFAPPTENDSVDNARNKRGGRPSWTLRFAAILRVPRISRGGPAAPTRRPSDARSPKTAPISPTSGVNRRGVAPFHCDVCKKSFANSATWNAHEASAKHVDARKNGSGPRTPTKGSPRPNLANMTPSSHARQFRAEAASPSVIETILKRRQLDSIAIKKPTIAVSVYWNMAKCLWMEGCAREAVSTLYRSISLLELLSDTNACQLVDEHEGLTSERAARTLQFARLSLARILAGCSPESAAIAREVYMKFIRDRLQRDAAEGILLQLARRGPVEELFNVAASVGFGERVQAEEATIKNCDLLAEYALTCLACSTIPDNPLAGRPCESWEESAIACAMATVCTTSRSERYIELLKCLCLIFEIHGKAYQVADCYLLIGRSFLHDGVQLRSSDPHVQRSCTQNEHVAYLTWAAILAIEQNDVVRFLNIQDTVSKILPLAADVNWHDLSLVIQIGWAKADQDSVTLSALRQVDLPLLRSRSIAGSDRGLARWMAERVAEEEAAEWDAGHGELRSALRTIREFLEEFWKRVAALLE